MDNNFGVDDFNAKLSSLSATLQKTIMAKAVKAGAQIVQDRATELAPKLDPELSSFKRWSGELAAGMLNRLLASTDTVYTVRIGPDKTTFWGLYSEKGTEFEQAKPWLRPALDETQDEALSAIGTEIWNGINGAL